MQTNRFGVGDAVTHGGTLWEVAGVRGGGRSLDLTRGGGGYTPVLRRTVPASAVRLSQAARWRPAESASVEPTQSEHDRRLGITPQMRAAQRALHDRAVDRYNATHGRVLVARHEGSHALVAWILGCDLSHVTIDPGDGRAAGITGVYSLGAEADIAVLVAGRVGERMHPAYRASLDDESWSDDYKRAHHLGATRAQLARVELHVETMLRKHAPHLSALEDALNERGSLTGNEVWALLDGVEKSSRAVGTEARSAGSRRGSYVATLLAPDRRSHGHWDGGAGRAVPCPSWCDKETAYRAMEPSATMRARFRLWSETRDEDRQEVRVVPFTYNVA
ncbi:hypothetical protein I6A60_31285 [Frankia sp. AgB1.9]|uniref:hypothetical protein n=1 Tax=unclassified Frankia TaxID=2632575 RepID=UPI001932354A|nr:MULTISPECIES: hypothetical protein [unclassified Frankia]MBL7493887.1 hypothetical protein [Frankia sp. AgW1.1]MBL7552314.1 hypothetical protein [Frankia sp. AgB1.9]MBL7622067.1 hypothetical protein [Frankia sp. AgB1.8]